jgi:hypothetical protein
MVLRSRDVLLFVERYQVTNIVVQKEKLQRLSQGDVLRDIECIEYVVEKDGVIEVAKIMFPLVVVLTQDCDLEQDSRYKVAEVKKPSTDDKRLFSVLVAPMYNAEYVFQGVHLSELSLNMTSINKGKTEGDYLRKNERARYQYLAFPEDVQVVPQIVDFKHFFSVNLRYLESLLDGQFVCRIADLFREDLSQRFAAYLSRIGLPDVPQPRQAGVR